MEESTNTRPERDDDEAIDAAAVPVTIDLAREYEEAGIAEVLDALDRELVGLKPVKRRVREIAALLLVEQVRERMGLSAGAPSLHMCFTGAWLRSCTASATAEKGTLSLSRGTTWWGSTSATPRPRPRKS